MPGKRTHFNSSWKSDPKFKSSLEEDPESTFSFFCRKCQVIPEHGNMGKGAITKHMNSQKHLGIEHSRQSQSAGLMASWAMSKNSSDAGVASEVNQN